MLFSNYTAWPSASTYASCHAYTDAKKTSASKHRDW